jgi:hypothetical protein
MDVIVDGVVPITLWSDTRMLATKSFSSCYRTIFLGWNFELMPHWPGFRVFVCGVGRLVVGSAVPRA